MAGPPPTALFGEAVLFLNHFVVLKPPKTVFLTSWPILFFMNIKKFSTQVLMCCFKTHSEHIIVED